MSQDIFKAFNSDHSFSLNAYLKRDIFKVLDTDHSTFLAPYFNKQSNNKENGIIKYNSKNTKSGSGNTRHSISSSNIKDCEEKSKRKSSGKTEESSLSSGNKECLSLADEIKTICNKYLNCQPTRRSVYLKQTNIFSPIQSATIIKNFLQGIKNKRKFRDIKRTLYELSKKDPRKILQLVNIAHAEIFEKQEYALVFKLSGEKFPPTIVYKLFYKRHIFKIECSKDRKSVSQKTCTSNWFEFNVYRCHNCKTSITASPRRIKKKKRKGENHISWIQDMYKL